MIGDLPVVGKAGSVKGAGIRRWERSVRNDGDKVGAVILVVVVVERSESSIFGEILSCLAPPQ